ncbi:MAG TPA: 50S ribosomal protein L4 [Candidatus Dormibacteraeota bacterium]|nr:50S ribosomal protein L4 [Candidatus Dormibacteraeota bacterium]
MTIACFTKTGNKAPTTTKLNKAVFGQLTDNHQLLQDAYQAYLANGRRNLAQTKTRGLVRGGGKKPWKQKGTGRARFGSSRNPIWRGGGIVFGPTGIENYTKNLNLKSKRQAIRQALSLAAEAGKVNIIDSLEIKSGKTADLVKLLAKIGAQRNILIVVDHKPAELERAARNIATLKLVTAQYVNVFDTLNADTIIIVKPALAVIDGWLGKTTK